MAYNLRYRSPGPVASSFLKHRPDRAGIEWPIDLLVGPIGSGKTSALCIRLFLHALEQPEWADGWRRSRWAVIRNTNPMLELTTIPTWLSWFPEETFGKFHWSPPFAHRIRLPDVKVEMEVLFVPLDRPDQVRNLLSLELTGAVVNETREVPREIVVEARSRCGRWPSLRDTEGRIGWAGVIGDTNAPPDPFHYVNLWGGRTEPPDWMTPMDRRLMAKPDGITVFWQPPGMFPVRAKDGAVTGFEVNPKAENLSNLRGGSEYYRAQLAGQTTAWALNMIACESVSSEARRPVHPTFRRAVHVADAPIEWDGDGSQALLAMDFARNPALVLGQEVDGQLRLLREWIGQNVSVEQFLNETLPALNVRYPDALSRYRGWGDPSGSSRTGADDNTAFLQARKNGLSLVPTWTNDPDERQAALDRRLDRLVEGRPALLVCPRGCPTLIQGLEGGYHFRRLKVGGTLDQFTEEIDKSNLFSHICDAAQYLALGLDSGGRRDSEMDRWARGRPANGRAHYDPLAASRAVRRGIGFGRPGR